MQVKLSDMRHYEIATVLHPDLEIDLDAPLKKVERIITDAGGTVEKKDIWGKRKLAYRINGQDWGIFVFYTITLEPNGVASIEDGLKIADEVMRHLIVSLENQKQVTKHKPGRAAPSAVAKTTKEVAAKPAAVRTITTKAADTKE